MVNSDKSIFEYDVSPAKQVIAVVLAIILFMVVVKMGNLIGLTDPDPETPWLIACSMTFFYAIGNGVMSISTEDQNTYWWQSMLGYISVAIVSSGLAYLFSGENMDDLGSYRWLFILFAIGHIFFLAIARSMRKVVKLAKKQDKRLRGED